MPDPVIFQCPPLRASLSEAQCLRNQARAHLANSKSSGKRNIRSQYKTSTVGDRITLSACLTCEGVIELVRCGLTDPPPEWNGSREKPE